MHIPSPAIGTRPVDVRSETAARMADAAVNFLASLSPDESASACFRLDSPERLKWDYRPRERVGLPLQAMNASQRKLAYTLLASGLSRAGQAKALTIMGLEAVLGELEGPNRRYDRDPDLYYISVFGQPADDTPWGWRIEGHHLSLNYLIVKGSEIGPTPNFFGANPAEVPSGPLAGLRTLAPEEDQARRLLNALDSDQRRRTVIDEEAPPDILTDNDPRVNLDEPLGLAYGEMTTDQQGLFMDLVVLYVRRIPPDVADACLNRIEKAGRAHICFAWAGSEERGRPHYYRLHGPSFFAEYDNTQNDANHIHSVWRDVANDWGEDLLKDHYRGSHRG